MNDQKTTERSQSTGAASRAEGANLTDVLERLLPCPFCGAEVTMGKGSERRTWYQVECDCGAIAGCAHTTEKAAIKDWNRRSNLYSTPEK